jgi:hypothetical protein
MFLKNSLHTSSKNLFRSSLSLHKTNIKTFYKKYVPKYTADIATDEIGSAEPTSVFQICNRAFEFNATKIFKLKEDALILPKEKLDENYRTIYSNNNIAYKMLFFKLIFLTICLKAYHDIYYKKKKNWKKTLYFGNTLFLIWLIKGKRLNLKRLITKMEYNKDLVRLTLAFNRTKNIKNEDIWMNIKEYERDPALQNNTFINIYIGKKPYILQLNNAEIKDPNIFYALLKGYKFTTTATDN